MAPAVVIERQIARKPAVPLLGGPEGHGIGPFLKQGLDEPLGFAVGSWCVRLGADRLEIECPAGFAPVTRAVGRAVV